MSKDSKNLFINFFKLHYYKYEDYEKQINFFKNTRMVIING